MAAKKVRVDTIAALERAALADYHAGLALTALLLRRDGGTCPAWTATVVFEGIEHAVTTLQRDVATVAAEDACSRPRLHGFLAPVLERKAALVATLASEFARLGVQAGRDAQG